MRGQLDRERDRNRDKIHQLGLQIAEMRAEKEKRIVENMRVKVKVATCEEELEMAIKKRSRLEGNAEGREVPEKKRRKSVIRMNEDLPLSPAPQIVLQSQRTRNSSMSKGGSLRQSNNSTKGGSVLRKSANTLRSSTNSVETRPKDVRPNSRLSSRSVSSQRKPH